MEEDDEFGDLYSDVLLPISVPPPPPHLVPRSPVAAPNPPPDPFLDCDDDDDRILYEAPSSVLPASPTSHPSRTLEPAAEDDDEDDWLIGRAPAAVEQPENWVDEDEEVSARPPVVPAPELPAVGQPLVLEEEGGGARASDGETDVLEAGGLRIPEENDGDLLGGEGAAKNTEIGDPYQELLIPGISAVPLALGHAQAVNGRDAKASGSDDWDSDSEDDLQIVLNDSNPVPLCDEMNDRVGSDEDGELDLVVLGDADQPHHHQAMEEHEWGEEAMQATVDGERKDITEAGRGNSLVGNASGARIGYNNHGFHPQHHSMYKYIRPSAGLVPGGPVVGAIGGPGQIRPPSTSGPIAGRGRGDWRPTGIRGISNGQKSFNSGYGLPGWANSSSGRAFGSGFDFTLPSHKTIFDIDIEGFEEKPWRYPGADISDFFNFGLDEDNWKDYCRQLEQLRLKATMQSKICVYESGRFERDYDPDLPPELAAAAGHHDSSGDNAHHCKINNEKDELNGQGKGTACIQTPLPIGRAIQVEVGYGERLPSIDTRPPRMRDSDAIIEIVLQDSLDDNGALKQPEKDPQGDLRGVHDFVEDDRQAESEYFDRFPHTSNGRKREMVARKAPFAPEGDGILPFPPESPHQYHLSSKLRSPVNIHGPFGTHPGGRLPQETSRGRHSSKSGEHSFDNISARSAKVNRHDNHQIEKAGDSTEGNQTSDHVVETARDMSSEQRNGEHDRLALGDHSIEVGEDLVSDFQGTPGDRCLIRSAKKQNLRSRVEQGAHLENGDDDDPRIANSDDNTAKSGSSKDYQKRREGGEEVVQDGRVRPMGDLRKQHEEELNLHRKGDYVRDGRHGIERNRIALKGREVMHHSYPHRDWDSNSAHTVRGRSEGFERPKEMDGPTSGRQRREDDTHSRRVKDEDTRRERHEETRSRNMNKVKASDRNNKDDGVHLKKQVDDGDWRGHHREGGPRQRDRDGVLMRRREVDDPQSKRKEEELSRREKDDKVDSLHKYRAKEDTSRRKRERDDGADHRRREDDIRIRDKAEDHHSAKHKDDSWRQREREESQRLKQPHEDLPRHREREGRGGMRNGRATEDKPLAGNGKNKDNSKVTASDKVNHHIDRRRQDEQFKRSDRAAERNNSQNKGREDVRAREKQSDNEERSSRRERLSSHSDRPSNASNSQQMHREKHRENTKKTKDIDVGEQNPRGSVKRKHGDYNTQRNEKVSLKGACEQESNNASSTTHSKKGHHQNNDQPEEPRVSHSSGKLGEEDSGSDDESQKGRSKLERWTSQKERDYTTIDSVQPLPSFPIVKEAEGIDAENLEMVQGGESARTEVNNASDSETKGADAGQVADRIAEDQDSHLDTVAKLKRRSERFKLPMPGEKETAVLNNKAEGEVQITSQDEATDEMEIKPERPARKRRWTSS